MRRLYRSDKPTSEGLPEGVLLFTLTTPDRDTYKTRFNPEGAQFRPAKPWLDTHDDGSCMHVIGKFEPVYQGPDALRVNVSFDMADETAAAIYRKHKEGFLEGCSLRFEPLAYHVEEESDGSKTLVYDKYEVLEGSSCGVPSNPQALMVRAAGVAEDMTAALIAEINVLKTRVYHPAQEVKPAMIKPEHRSTYRYAIGDSLRAAHDHMDMCRVVEHPEHKKFHREAALAHMGHATHMTRMVADSIAEGHEDAPQDAALVGSMMRVAPLDEMAKEWEICQRAALAYADRTWADVGKDSGAKDPSDLQVKLAAGKTTTDAYKRMLGEQRNVERKTENDDRLRLIGQLRASAAGLEPGLEAQMLGFDPVGYDSASKTNTRKGSAWTLDNIRRYQTEVDGAVTPIVRIAPLKGVETEAKITGAENIPAPAPHARSADFAAGLEAKLAEAARSTGMDLEKLKETTRKVARMQGAL